MKHSDIQADVTERILEALEGKLLPWRRGWKCSPNAGLCTSLSTGKEYSGINQILNAEQCRDLDRFHVDDTPVSTSTFERHEQAEELIRASNCTFNFTGSTAFYCPQNDEITMPHRENFESPEQFYEVAMHELCHHAENRTGFDRSKNSYGFGELCAEMGSCFLMARLQLETRTSIENSAAYLKHWLRSIRQDNRFIFRAASQAQRAADFIWSRAACPIEVTDVMPSMTPA